MTLPKGLVSPVIVAAALVGAFLAGFFSGAHVNHSRSEGPGKILRADKGPSVAAINSPREVLREYLTDIRHADADALAQCVTVDEPCTTPEQRQSMLRCFVLANTITARFKRAYQHQFGTPPPDEMLPSFGSYRADELRDISDQAATAPLKQGNELAIFEFKVGDGWTDGHGKPLGTRIKKISLLLCDGQWKVIADIGGSDEFEPPQQWFTKGSLSSKILSLLEIYDSVIGDLPRYKIPEEAQRVLSNAILANGLRDIFPTHIVGHWSNVDREM